MNKMMWQVFAIAIVALSVTACKEKKREDLLPPITGKPGEVVLVMEENLYKGMAGDSIFNLLSQQEPALPQYGMEGGEPMFDLVQIPHAAFTKLFRTHRNLIITRIGSQIPKPAIRVERNYWAKTQLILRLDAPDKKQFVKLVEDNRDFIIQTLRNAEIHRQMLLNVKYENIDLALSMLRNHQINMSFPKGFELKVDTGHFLWVQYEPEEMIQGVFIWDRPYTSESQLDYGKLVRYIDRHLKPRVPGSSPGSYMAIEFDAPVFSRVFEHNGCYTRELKGLWKMEGDWMGGPFIAWTLVDERRQRLVTCFGFIYAPKYNKRNLIRKIESILTTIKFPD
ncbi:MAG: DUF4837 family protein [Bacteroidales bacterium]|nr:DUF4837 family protein [Bacteroidales bacterium]